MKTFFQILNIQSKGRKKLMTKILFFSNTSKTVIDFRRELIKYLIQNDFEILVIAGDDKYKNEIIELGVSKFYCVNFNNRSINPFNFLKIKRSVRKIIKAEAPDIVFTFQHKPNIVGFFAAKKENVQKIYCMIEGLGDAFIKKSLKFRLAKFILEFRYKKILKFVNCAFVLNKEDYEYFHNLSKKDDNLELINGIGIDCDSYQQKAIQNFNSFFMAARLLKSKGIITYLEVARKLKKHGLTFYLAGQEGDVKQKKLLPYIQDKSIIYLGHLYSIDEYIEKSTCFVLPTYREGMPRSILEAMAIGRPIITTNVPGCNVEVINDFNGYLIELDDVVSNLEKAILQLVNLNREKIVEMGNNSRKRVETMFNSKIINEQILKRLKK